MSDNNMKQEIETFKCQNGNIKYSVKELLYAIHSKIDTGFEKIDNRFDAGNKKFASKKMVIGMYSAVTALLGALAYYTIIILK